MDLRPRHRTSFTGFTQAELQKMEHLLTESKEQLLEKQFCKKLAGVFNRSSGRAGKPVVKWTEIQKWFEKNGQQVVFKGTSSQGNSRMPLSENAGDSSKLEFEARSSKDGAWYDVDNFLGHRFLSSGDMEVRVRYVGFGSEEDEWVNAKSSLRERSVPLEHFECQKLEVGDSVVCFQEREDQARYYDARIKEIERRWHDIRGCRCLFLITYDHDNSEEKVRLRRLCCRPSALANSD